MVQLLLAAVAGADPGGMWGMHPQLAIFNSALDK